MGVKLEFLAACFVRLLLVLRVVSLGRVGGQVRGEGCRAGRAVHAVHY